MGVRKGKSRARSDLKSAPAPTDTWIRKRGKERVGEKGRKGKGGRKERGGRKGRGGYWVSAIVGGCGYAGPRGRSV